MALAIGKPLSAEQRIQKATMDLIGNDEFLALAGVLMIGKKHVKEDIPTACTDGRDEFYGRKFVDGMGDAELRFLMLHEAYHKMYRHLTTWAYLNKANKMCANMACDYVINIKLADTKAFANDVIKMPSCGGLLDEQYRGMNVPEVFKRLMDDAKSGEGDGDGDGNSMDEHDWDGAKEMSTADQNALAKEIDEAVRQGAIMANKLGSGGDRLVNDLLQTKQDWKELLKDFVTNTCAGKDYSSWRSVNRRYVGMDLLMPGAVSEVVGDIVIAIDTSGSIGQVELSSFLGEVTGISSQVRPSRVHVLYWDTEVARHEVYLQDELENIAKSTKPAGGGGTNVACVTPYLRERDIKAECVVVLTDGYLGGEWGTWDMPTLWVIQNHQSAVAPVGKTIHID